MSKLILAASVLGMLASPAFAAPPSPPNEPEQTIDAIGADVTARTQWFGQAIDHLFTEEAPPPAAVSGAQQKAHRPTQQ